MPSKLKFGESFLDQRKVLLWGKYVALCGDKPGMPVNFLRRKTIGYELTSEEKADVLEFVWREVGPPMRHRQCDKEWFIVQQRIESKADSSEQ